MVCSSDPSTLFYPWDYPYYRTVYPDGPVDMNCRFYICANILFWTNADEITWSSTELIHWSDRSDDPHENRSSHRFAWSVLRRMIPILNGIHPIEYRSESRSLGFIFMKPDTNRRYCLHPHSTSQTSWTVRLLRSGHNWTDPPERSTSSIVRITILADLAYMLTWELRSLFITNNLIPLLINHPGKHPLDVQLRSIHWAYLNPLKALNWHTGES